MNRKKFGLRLASLAVFLLLPLSGAAALEEMDGDLDGNGRVTAADAARLMRIAAGIETMDHSLASIADVTGNLSVTHDDARAVLLLCCGRLNSFADLSGAIEAQLLGESYLDKFSYTGAVKTENGYRSARLSVSISRMRFLDSACYVADIYVRDITCLRSAFSRGEYEGRRETALAMAENNGAVIAVTGDMYTMNADGAIVRNGVYYNDRRVTKKKDLGVLYRDGTFRTYARGEMTLEDLKASGEIWQMWVFGPMLLDESGEPMSKFNCNSSILGNNPRTAIGYYSPGHYCLVVVDGRQKPYSAGLRMEDLSQLMYELGCTAAYNLDGGQSASMSDGQRLINCPSGGGRSITDIVYLGEPLA